jgi:MtaA/CmuA family methyltransferase
MRREIPDRVPVVPLIDMSYAAACFKVPVSLCFLDPALHARALVSVLERHPGIDGLSINIGLTPDSIREVTRTEAECSVTTLDGSQWQFSTNDTGIPTRHEITRFDDQRLYSVNVLRPHIVETLRSMPKDILRNYDISVGLTGPFSQVVFMAGIEMVLLAMYEQPQALRQAIEARVPLSISWLEEIVALGAPSVWIGEGLASGSLISPRQYAEFVLPYEQPLTERLRELKVPSVLHVCGETNGILEAVAQSGADCFEVDWQVDLAEAKTRIGRQISLKGNLHTTDLIQLGPKALYQESCAAIKKAKAGGGFILSSGCALGRDTPPENVEAMVEAAMDCGLYN